MWHKPCRTFHPWCPCIKTRCLSISLKWCYLRVMAPQPPATSTWYWSRDKVDAISQTTFWNAFSWMKMFELRLKFHWSLFPRVQLIIFQHWFRWWLDTVLATSHYLNQWWLVNRCIYMPGLGSTPELELELGSTPTPELELELELKPPELELELELIFWRLAGVGVGVETSGVGVGVGVDIMELTPTLITRPQWINWSITYSG